MGLGNPTSVTCEREERGRTHVFTSRPAKGPDPQDTWHERRGGNRRLSRHMWSRCGSPLPCVERTADTPASRRQEGRRKVRGRAPSPEPHDSCLRLRWAVCVAGTEDSTAAGGSLGGSAAGGWSRGQRGSPLPASRGPWPLVRGGASVGVCPGGCVTRGRHSACSPPGARLSTAPPLSGWGLRVNGWLGWCGSAVGHQPRN